MGRLGDTQIVVGVILGCTVNDSKEIDIAAGVVDVRGGGRPFWIWLLRLQSGRTWWLCGYNVKKGCAQTISYQLTQR